MSYRRKYCKEINVDVGSIGCLILLFFMLGWIMNFQNIWQYWPEDSLLRNCSMQFILSLIGIPFFPLGIITGWAF